ncbi:Pathogenicity locus [Flavihumibacter sp. R14]|nr:Pathogenicity locus [Flavihumibacter soli]
MKKTIQLDLTPAEKKTLKLKKVAIKDLVNYAPDELVQLVGAGGVRKKEIRALMEFQSIPSLGYNFARELIEQGYYSLEQLRGKDAVALFDAYEKHCNAWADPCVEDSYRLLVHFIEHRDESKRWWHFTRERKDYRLVHGFAADRPKKAWHELTQYKKSAP